MKRLISSLMLIVFTVAACSTPDGGPWDNFLADIAKMSPQDLWLAKRMEANRRAREDLKGNSQVVGTLHCQNGDDTSQVTVDTDKIKACMSDPTFMFADCVMIVVQEMSDAYVQRLLDDGTTFHDPTGCRYVANPDFKIDPKWDGDNLTNDDLARGVVESHSPPAWLIALGIVTVGAGGIVVFASGWGAVLCPLDISWAEPSCPQAPDGSGTHPGSSSSGGDR